MLSVKTMSEYKVCNVEC